MAETPNLNLGNTAGNLMQKIENPTDHSFALNFYLSQVNSGAALLMLKVHCLSSEYDALIDQGISHNFVSQQIFDELRQAQKISGEIGVEQQQQDHYRQCLRMGPVLLAAAARGLR